MKKLRFVLIALFLFDWLIGGVNGGFIPEAQAQAAVTFNFTSLNAATTTGAGSSFQPATETVSGFTWTQKTTGTPTGVTVNLEGSLNGTDWFTLDSSTATTSEMRHVANKDVAWLRCNLATFTGGSSPTETCVIYKGKRANP